jgi:hypothetical protein
MPCLFPELDEDRIRRGHEPENRGDPDLGLDRGPDQLLQRRLPSAGFVRLVENPTPCFELPRRRDYRNWGICARCDRFGVLEWMICAGCRALDTAINRR